MEKLRGAGLERRKSPRQARSTVTVDAIFEATIQVLLNDGPTRLTTTRVAERAGVSVGTLYQYFPNKRSLLYATLEKHINRLTAAVETACVETRHASIDRMAAAIVQSYLRAKLEQQEASQAFYLIAVELDARELIETATCRAEAAVTATLATASDAHVPSPHLAARMVLAAVSGTARVFFERGLIDRSGFEVEDQLTTMCRSYLGTVSSTAQPASTGS